MTYFRYKSIILDNYRSFKQATFILDRPPGLYYIHGTNKLNPAEEGNRVGKTTLLSAIVLAQCGKDIEKLKGNHLKRFDAKSGSVTLSLEKNDIPCTIQRKLGTSTISLTEAGDEKTVTQDTLEKFFMSVGYDQLLMSQYISQLNSAFLDLDPTPQLDLFSSVIGLDFWLKCADIAKSKTTTAKSIVDNHEAGLTGLRARLTALQEAKAKLQEQRAAFDGTKATKLNEQSLVIATFRSQLDTTTKELTDATFQLDLANDAGITLEKELDRVVESKQEVEADLSSINGELGSLRTKESFSKQELAKWQAITDACPYCLQTVDKDFLAKEKSTIIKTIIEIGRDVKAKDTKSKETSENLVTINAALSQLKSSIKEQNTRISDWYTTVNNLKRSQSNLEVKIEEAIKAHDTLINAVNPYLEGIAENWHQVKQCQSDISELESKLLTANKDYTGNEFWQKEFKNIRLWLINQALTALEIETNNSIAQLGLPDWALKFRMERETTKGDISKGFDVLVNCPDYKEAKGVPFKVWSGSERQRLKLGNIFGNANLVKNYKGVDFNTMWFDEPSSFLSPSNQRALIEFLADMAKTENKVIYYIDQREYESTLFDGVIEIIRDADGSHIKDCV